MSDSGAHKKNRGRLRGVRKEEKLNTICCDSAALPSTIHIWFGFSYLFHYVFFFFFFFFFFFLFLLIKKNNLSS